jgi:glycerol-3-phosphate acyltransferase PlsY
VGVALAIEPLPTIILLLVSFIGIPFHQFPITAMISMFLVPVITLFSNAAVISSLFAYPLGNQRLAVTLVLFGIFLITPIRRLTVPVSSLGKTVSRRELMVNRLLFDRDIRDRKAWLNRNPSKNVPENKEGQAR